MLRIAYYLNMLYNNDEEINDNYNDFDEELDNELDEELDNELNKYKLSKKKKPREREYYVKGADLIAEIKKYQDSKRADAEARGVPLEER